MAIALTPTHPPTSADIPDMPIYQLTVAQYHDLLRRNTEVDREPVELLEGWVVPKIGEDAIHSAAVAMAA